MIKEFRLPDLGEGLTESEIVSWKVGVGDTVTLNQIIAEVETAKAVVELPSPYAGVITALLEQPGSVVEVGKPIVSIEVETEEGSGQGGSQGGGQGDGGQAGGVAGAGAADSAPAAKREPNLVGYGAVLEHSGPPVRRARRFASAAADHDGPVMPPGSATTMPGTVPGTAPSAAPGPVERPRSTPPVRKLAKDLGMDLETVTGTGGHGLITREDVLSAARGSGPQAGGQEKPAPPPAAAPATATQPGTRETRTPIRGVRKFTAAAMVASAFTAPHATEFLTIDVTATMDLLARLKASRSFSGYKLTPLTLAAKAVLVTLRSHPALNSRWDEANQEIVQFNYVNLGIAAATPRGLTVPNIKDADRMSLAELSAALSDLTQTAREGRTSPADLSGGTISITNIGVFGIDAGTPILNPGEAAILALGAVRRMPWEYQDEVALRQVMTLSLSFDHRLVDGEQASRFLQDLGAILADPGMALALA